MKDFFISYNKSDKEYAKWIAGILEQNNYSTIIQAWDFRPGNNFVVEMHKAVQNCKKIIIVLSQNYIKSEYCQAEWASIFTKDPTGNSRSIIPVRISNVIPTGLLASIIYVDLVDVLDENVATKKLLNAIDETPIPRMSRKYPRAKPLIENKRYSLSEILSNNKKFSNNFSDKFYLPIGIHNGKEVSMSFTHDSGNCLIVGRPGSGKTNFLYNIIFSSIMRHSIGSVNINILERKFSPEYNLFKKHNYKCINIYSSTSDFLNTINNEFQSRSKLLKNANCNNIFDYNKANPPLPWKFYIIEAIPNLFTHCQYEILIDYFTKARAYGICFFISTYSICEIENWYYHIEYQFRYRVFLGGSQMDSKILLGNPKYSKLLDDYHSSGTLIMNSNYTSEYDLYQCKSFFYDNETIITYLQNIREMELYFQ